MRSSVAIAGILLWSSGAGAQSDNQEVSAATDTVAEDTAELQQSDDDFGSEDDWGDEAVEDVEVAPLTDTMTWYSEAYPQFSRGFNLFYARPARVGTWHFVVQHRANTAIDDDPFSNLLGLDGGGLKIGLVVRYGLWDNLDVGVMRLNGTAEPYDTYEFDLRYALLNEKEHFVNLAVRGGLSWFAEEGNNATGGFGQLLVDRVFFNRLLVGLQFMGHSDSSNQAKSNADDDYSLAAGLALDLRILDNFAWGLEISQAVAGYSADNPVFTTGPKVITNRHTFSILVSNSQDIAADGIITNTARDFDELLFGFQITREI